MTARWALCVLLLSARPAELRHRPEVPGPAPGPQAPGPARAEDALAQGRALTRGARSGTARVAAGHRTLDPQHGTGGRDHSTLDPDRFFTTPRTAAPPPLNASLDAALLPLMPLRAGAPWAYAVLLLGLALLCAGLVGNLALVCVVWNTLHLKSAWNCVLAALALWDFLVLFFCLPLVLVHELTGTRLVPALSCSLVPFLQVSSMGVATFSLCALSIDRFHSATSPAPMSVHVEPCTSILPKLSVVFVGSVLLAAPELLLYRSISLPPQATRGHYSAQLDVCLAEPAPELPLAVLSLVLTYQEARSWWMLGCYICLPLLFTLSCDLVTRRVTSQRAAQLIGPQESRSSSPSVGLNRSPALSVSKQEVSSHTSSVNRKFAEREAGLRSVVLALIGLYCVCTLPEAAWAVGVSYLPALPVAAAAALRLIGQFLLFARCSATPLVALAYSRALGRAFARCCCCCCDECGAAPPLATPCTLLATPLTVVAPPLQDTPSKEQWRALGTPC